MSWKSEIHLGKSFYTPKLFKSLLSYKEFERLVNLRPFVNGDRFFPTNGQKYNWSAGGWLTDVNSWPPHLIAKLLKECVVYLTDCSRVNQQINDIAKTLEQQLKFPCDAHIFYSYKKFDTGFGRHKDNQHNLIVCCQGRYDIKIYEQKTRLYNMKPGDAVWVPAQTEHQVIPMGKRLSVSFTLDPKANFFQEREWINV